MDKISIRYGEDVTLPIYTGNANNVTATLYVGKPGQVYVLDKQIALTDGEGVFELDQNDTKIPLGEYKYQINVVDSNGKLKKFPSPKDNCTDCFVSLPDFIVFEAIDEIEVS